MNSNVYEYVQSLPPTSGRSPEHESPSKTPASHHNSPLIGHTQTSGECISRQGTTMHSQNLLPGGRAPPVLRNASASLTASEMDRIPPADQERWDAYYYHFVKAIAAFNDLKFKRFPEPLQAWNSSDGSDVGSINSPCTK